MDHASQASSFRLQENFALTEEWVAQFRRQAIVQGFSGRVDVAVFEPETRSFAVLTGASDEQGEAFLLSQLAAESLDRLAEGRPVVLPAQTWPAGASDPVVMFPLLRRGVVWGAVCAQAPSESLTPDRLQALVAECARALDWGGAPLSPFSELRDEAAKQAMALRVMELHARNEMKSRIVSNLLHELRSPLVAVRGYARMVLEGHGGPLTTTQQEFLSIVAENTSRLVKAVNHAAQLDPDELTLARHDLLQLWRAAAERVRPAAQVKGIRISERVPEGCFEIVIDGAKITQVIEALLDNSVKFAGINGEIIGEFVFTDDDCVVLRISDTGPGIPAGFIEKMFDRYYQAEAALAAGGQAERGGPDGFAEPADVRLPMVYDIVRLHGGRLTVMSDAGEGCRFVVELPAIRANNTQEGLPSNEQASRSSSGR